MSNISAISLQNVDLSFRLRTLLSGVNYEFAPGSFHFVIGDNGVGKSSLLKLMNGLLQPESGRVSVFGSFLDEQNSDDMADIRYDIGFVSQDYSLVSHITILDNIMLPLLARDAVYDDALSYARAVLSWAGLGDCLIAYPSDLSHGQLQKALIVRAIIADPKILIFDKPMSFMDSKSCNKFFRLFQEMNRRGATVIFATQDEEFANSQNYPVLCLLNGEVITRSDYVKEDSDAA